MTLSSEPLFIGEAVGEKGEMDMIITLPNNDEDEEDQNFESTLFLTRGEGEEGHPTINNGTTFITATYSKINIVIAKNNEEEEEEEEEDGDDENNEEEENEENEEEEEESEIERQVNEFCEMLKTKTMEAIWEKKNKLRDMVFPSQ